MLSEKHSKGAFQISRSLFDSKIWIMPPEYTKAWVWIVGKCNHKTIEKYGQVFQRGECLFTLDELQKQLSYKVGYRTKSPTKWQAWKICDWLRKEDMITTTKTMTGFFVKVHKYEQYQVLSNYEANNKTKDHQTIDSQQADNINNNENNEENLRMEEHPETSLLLKRIIKNCEKFKISNEVSAIVLDKLVGEYGGRIVLSSEIEKCFNWTIENGLKSITASRLGNWFRREWDDQKKRQRKNQEDVYQKSLERR